MAITYKLNVTSTRTDKKGADRANVTVEKTDGEIVTSTAYTDVLVDTAENRAKFLATIKAEESKAEAKISEQQAKTAKIAADLDKDVLVPLAAWDRKAVK